ncbi:hypothetical protein EDC04DRAFT_2924248, partial [Pisolithus marmoratus]
AASFTPTLAELALVNRIFAQEDIGEIGVLTSDVAANVFSGSKLPITVLAEIWDIADEENDGFLTKKGVAIALRLMGHAQKGVKVHKSLLSVRGPLATIGDVLPPLEQQGMGISIPKTPPSTLCLPPLTSQDRATFLCLFQSGGPVDGLLSGIYLAFQGEKARDLLVESMLPIDTLSQIWDLCDTQNRGALDSVDFTIAMYLVQAITSGELPFVPIALPSGLYEQATSPTSPVSPIEPPLLQSQFAGRDAYSVPPVLHSRRPLPVMQTPMPLRRPFVSWDITPDEKAIYDQYFDALDTFERGYLEAEIVVPFMLQSELPEEVLALIWDLADINIDGRLTRDGFAVAMCLIEGKLAGKDVPNTLPPTLVPQSMRKTTSQLSEPIRDLLWDERSPTSDAHDRLHALHQLQLTESLSFSILTVFKTLSKGYLLRPQPVCLAGYAMKCSVIHPRIVNVTAHIVVLA